MIRTGLAWSAVLVLTALAISAGVWSVISDAHVATHWNAAGEADGWMPKGLALLMMPGFMVLIAALIGGLTAVLPLRGNLEASRAVVLVGWIGTLGLLLLVHLFVVLNALGVPVGISVVHAAVAVLIMALGNLMAKSRRNWLVGVRTPWSLSSDDAWVASNRVAGWGFVGTGALSLLGLVVSMNVAVNLLLAGLFASIVMSVIVSYRVWKRDTG